MDGREIGEEGECGSKNESGAPRKQVCGSQGACGLAGSETGGGVIGPLTALCLVPGTVGQCLFMKTPTSIKGPGKAISLSLRFHFLLRK